MWKMGPFPIWLPLEKPTTWYPSSLQWDKMAIKCSEFSGNLRGRNKRVIQIWNETKDWKVSLVKLYFLSLFQSARGMPVSLWLPRHFTSCSSSFIQCKKLSLICCWKCDKKNKQMLTAFFIYTAYKNSIMVPDSCLIHLPLFLCSIIIFEKFFLQNAFLQ